MAFCNPDSISQSFLEKKMLHGNLPTFQPFPTQDPIPQTKSQPSLFTWNKFILSKVYLYKYNSLNHPSNVIPKNDTGPPLKKKNHDVIYPLRIWP